MMHKPWDCAQPDEWLPQSLRLCWGDGGDGGMGDGGGNTGGGDWGSSGSYDASGFNAGGDLGAWAGTAYDASVFGSGAGGGGDWGSFGATNYSGMNAPNPTFADVAGPNPGVTTGGGDWGSAGMTSFTGTGGGLGGAMFGADTYGGGGGGGGGFWGSTDSGGGGGGFYGGGGQQGGGGSFGGFAGGRGSVTDSTPGYVGTVSGGRDVTGSEMSSPYADDTGPGGRGEQDTVSPAPADFGKPSESEAAPEAEAGPSLTDAAPAGMIHGGSLLGQDNAPAETEATPSHFGPESVISQEGRQALSDLTQSALAPQQDSFDSRFGFETAAPPDSFDSRFGFDTSAPAPSIEATIPGGQQTDFDYGPGQQTAAPNFDQVFADLGIQPGWDLSEQTAGRTGLAEPTDWAANPYQPSTDVSVGRDFNQAFEPFGDKSGMDLAGDQKSEAEPSLTFNEMWGTTPYSTLPNDQLSRTAQQTLEHDFGYFPNPGYVQGPQEQTLEGRVSDVMNAIINPVANVTMYPFAKGLDYLMGLSNPTNITDPATAWSNFAQNALLGGSNIQSLNADAFNAFEAGQQGRAGANPDTTPWGEVFEGAAPTEAQPSIEAFIPGSRETNFDPTAAEILAAQQPAPIDVEVVRSDDPSVPADPRADPAAPPAMPPAVPPEESRPAEQPQEAQPPPPQEAQPAPPSLVDMLPPPALTPPTQPPGVPPSETRPAETPAEPGRPDDHDDAPEPQDTSQPPQDPNAPRPPESIPGQITGSRGTYTNSHLDNPRVNSNYRDSGRTDYPQGRPGITFRTARQAGVEPLFRTEDINVRDVDARLVENINRALRDMERTRGIPANSLVATSGWRPAHRGEAHEHGQDPRTSQESVYTRYNPNGRNIGPAAQPGRSNHGPGRALDFSPKGDSGRALAWLRAHAREYGLETLGGTFDIPHIQLQRGQGGQRPSEQEQAEQRALDAQNRQLAQDRGLIAPGRGNQLAGVPTPRARPTDAPQPQVAQPQPPAEVPANIPQQQPAPPAPPPVDRPLADIPAPAPVAPTPAQTRAGHVNAAKGIIAEYSKGLEKPGGDREARATVAYGKAGAAMAKAGVPANIARAELLKASEEGAARAGYSRSMFMIGGKVGEAIDKMVDAAMQAYQAALPGKRSDLPSGQQYAALSEEQGNSLLDFMQNFNPISTAEARGGRGHAGNLQAPRADSGTIQSRLSEARSGIVNELQTNQGLRNTLDLIVTGEVGSQGKAAVLGFLETAMNKVAAEASREGRTATGRDLLNYLNNRSYFPDTWGKIESGKVKGGALTDDLIGAIAAGSNTTKGSTGNSSATSPGSRFGGNPTNVTIGKEHYGVENYGHHAAWYNALGALDDMPAVGFMPPMPPPAPAELRGLAKGGHVDKDEKVVVGEEGPEFFIPDEPGTVVPHMPQARREPSKNIDRWPKVPAVGYPGRYGGVEREILRQTREAQDVRPALIDMIDSGRLPLNEANWRAMMNDPGLIALGRLRMEDRREGIDPGAEQYGAFIPPPAPAAEPPDPTSPMAQALGYGSIKRRPMQIGRQSY